MKKLTLLLASVFAIALQSFAHGYGHARINSYADAFVFDEMGVTFSVYPDGEFDFYMDNVMQSTVSNGFVDVTFNSGYNYNPYVQYDDFGAVIQVENVPIYYDYYGRVSQIGDVLINYRNRRVSQVGGLHVFYNRHGHYAYHTGFINVWNPYFVYRPFYVAFARPAINLCFVRTTPYRQYYKPVRYTYYRPYVTNIRPCYATVGTVYRPRSGYGQVHGRYSQAPRSGERPVMRERRKITTATANARPAVSNRSQVTSRSNTSGYSRGANAVKPATSRTTTNRATQSVNTRSSKPSTSSVRTNGRSTQSSPARTSGSRTTTSSRVPTSSKPASTVNRSVEPQTNESAVQSRGSSSSSRAVRPSSSSRSTAQKPTSTSRSSSSGTRAVKPSSSSRNSVSTPRTGNRSSSSVSRSSSRSSVSKGSSSSSKSGGKVSVGNRSSNRGR